MINEIKRILQNIQEQRPVKDEAIIYGNYTTTKFKMRGGEDEDIILPDSFTVRLPYAKGNYDKLYDVEVNLVYDNRGGVSILIQAPKFEQAEEKALLDEVEFLKEELKQYPELLVLFNF